MQLDIQQSYGKGLVAAITTSTTPAVVALPPWATGVKVYASTLSRVAVGTTFAAPSTTITNQIQTVTILGTPTGGTFTLTSPFHGVTTGTIAYNASSANVETALVSAAIFAAADITNGGGALPGTAVTLEWTGSYAGIELPLLTGNVSGLTGGTNVAIVVTQTQAVVNPYSWVEGGTIEYIPVIKGDLALTTAKGKYLYIAAESTAGTARVTFLRG